MSAKRAGPTSCLGHRVSMPENAAQMPGDYFNHAPGLFFVLRMEHDGRMSMPFVAGDLKLVPGLRPQEVSETIEPLLSLLHPDDATTLVAELHQTARSLEPFCLEIRIASEKASLTVLSMTAAPRCNPGPSNAVDWHGFLYRGAAPKYRDRQQSGTKAFSSTLLDAVPVPVYYKDRMGRYLGCNNAFEEFFGYSREQLVGKSLLDIFPRDLAEAHHSMDETLYREGKVQRFETKVADVHGVVRDAMFSKAVFRDELGEPSGLIGAVLDITERKQIERELEETLDFAEGVIAAIPDVLFEVDREGRYLNIWTRNQELLAQSKEHLIGKTVHDALPPEAAFDALQAIQLADDNGYSDGGVIPIPQQDGTVRWFEHTIAKKVGHSDATPTFFVLSRDVTERKQAEQVINEARERLLTVLQTIPDMVWLKDENGRYLLCNHAFRRFVGKVEADIVGKTDYDLFDAEQAELLRMKDQAALDAGHILINEEWGIDAESGEPLLLEKRKVPVFGSEGKVSGVLGVARDITEVNASREQIKRLAFYDPLTSLPNRALFNDRLSRTIANVRRSGKLAGVMLIDLDHFKAVNDTMGHPAGDGLLQQVAARLCSCVREGATVARFGGDEFAILQPEVRHGSDLETVAERVLEALNAGFTLDGREVFTSCSIGISLCPNDSIVADDLVRYADSAMYLSKRSGRSTFRYYSNALERSASDYLTLQSELRAAIGREELELHYQPKVLLRDGRMIGSEALLRWCHPQKGMIPPDEFIPVAEETGLIRDLGRWVLNEASRAAAEWNSGNGPPHKIAVNLSAKEFQCQNLVGTVADTLDKSGCRPEWIEIEITESLLLDERTGVAETLSALREMGISIAIDDFGTGYSALCYLTRFPIDTLKIDRSFINKSDFRSLELVKAILSIARGLGQTVVAEGVESAEQADFLTAHGCDAAQGFFFSKPMKRDELKASITLQNSSF